MRDHFYLARNSSSLGSLLPFPAFFSNHSMEAQSKFRQFISLHQDSESHQYIYRDRLKANVMQGDHYLTVDLNDLHSFDSQLHSLLRDRPAEFIPYFEQAASDLLVNLFPSGYFPKAVGTPSIQIMFKNYPRNIHIRKLNAVHVSQLVTVSGIIISAAKPRIKATKLSIMCRNCRVVKQIRSGQGFGTATLPRVCDTQPADGGAKCPLDPFVILADSSKYINVQTMKLQESPEAVPTGEMPRHVSLSCERGLVGNVKPGTRVSIIGIYSTFTPKLGGPDSGKAKEASGVGVHVPYIRVVGIEQESEANNILLGRLSLEDEEDMRRLVSSTPNLYEAIAASVAPAIMGKEDIKKAIACSLFGGCSKSLPDGMRLRGDINVLLLGDPSVAKSQFLKFASQAAPISVYTSGKGSSAAGLTASVIRDPGSGEFHLEGGALVLADGGIVCIDEFDKMREQDRVAIHEAMEQQTISIAKAGITTILNSRTSVLAAANPVFGRYDDMKSATDNIDFQATILSRFDLIFIIRDLQDEAQDQELARHIINVHKKVDGVMKDLKESVIPVEKLQKLIAYARRIRPTLTESASQVLLNRYVAFRQDMAQRRREERAQMRSATERFNTTGNAEVIPITVRQLEAIIRLSEALARMQLSTVATEVHVEEALRLFKVATLQAATSPFGEVVGSPQFAAKLKEAENWLLRNLPFGESTSTKQLMKRLILAGHDENAGWKALHTLVQRHAFTFEKQRMSVRRVMGTTNR